MAQKTAGLIGFEIADGRPGKKADPAEFGQMRRYCEFLCEVLDQRMHHKVRQIAVKLRQVLQQKVAGDVDRKVSLDSRCRAQQDARFTAGTTPELDQCTAGWKQRSDGRRILLQNGDFAARRIIFRQFGDALEESRALQIIKILWRLNLWIS